MRSPLLRGAVTRLLVLLVLLAAVGASRLVRGEGGAPITLAGAALLLAGIFAGKISAVAGLPRLTGYLLIGVLLGPYVLRFIPAEGLSGLELVKGLAVALIALAAGTELRWGLVRRLGARVAVLCVAVSAVVFLVAGVGLFVARESLPFFDGLTVPQSAAVAAMVATVIISFSPTVTIAIVQETGARGRFTEFLMAFVILGDLIVLVAFALAASIAEASFGGAMDLGRMAAGVGWEIFGSIAVGAVIGVGALLYLRRVGREIPLFITVVCFVAAETGVEAHLSPLLLTLAAGAAIANLDEHQAERLNRAIEHAGLPVFALFFAAVGAGLALDVLAVVGPAALAIATVRGVAIWWACRRFSVREEEPVRRYLWMGLVSQAGVTFGLAALMRTTFPEFGPAIEALILALVTINQLVGPVLVRRALERTGEIPRAARAETA